MDKVFAVLRNKGGAHESMDVMSVWTTHENAQQEADRLNKSAYAGHECEVREWILNESGDGINW